ncbi:MAG: hypothetical protein WA082_03830 [Candidatus Moraniibacteriota bacterium]
MVHICTFEEFWMQAGGSMFGGTSEEVLTLSAGFDQSFDHFDYSFGFHGDTPIIVERT